eukprot:941357-Rhodomonas_salina.2
MIFRAGDISALVHAAPPGDVSGEFDLHDECRGGEPNADKCRCTSSDPRPGVTVHSIIDVDVVVVGRVDGQRGDVALRSEADCADTCSTNHSSTGPALAAHLALRVETLARWTGLEQLDIAHSASPDEPDVLANRIAKPPGRRNRVQVVVGEVGRILIAQLRQADVVKHGDAHLVPIDGFSTTIAPDPDAEESNVSNRQQVNLQDCTWSPSAPARAAKGVEIVGLEPPIQRLFRVIGAAGRAGCTAGWSGAELWRWASTLGARGAPGP